MATPAPQPFAASSQPSNGIATAGMVCGILAILTCWIAFVGLILGLLGIVFGALGMSKAGKLGGRGKGAAVAGLVCGILSFVLVFLVAAIAIPAFLEYMNKGKKTESSLHLRTIEVKIKSFRNEKGRFPKSASLMPGDPAQGCTSGTPLPPRPESEWVAAGWGEMGFHIDEPSRYAFRWTETGNGGYAEALADLDCDGTVSITRLDLDVEVGNVTARYHEPTPD